MREQNLVKVEGDGNCFFRCISQYQNGNQNNHREIRIRIIQTMRNNRNFYEAYTSNNFEEHINNMSRWDGDQLSWATDAEIMATSECYNLDVFVYGKIGQNWDWFKYSIYEECNHNRGFITIQYKDSHYNLIINKDRPCKCGISNPGNGTGNIRNQQSFYPQKDSHNIKIVRSNVPKQTKNKRPEINRSNLITLVGNKKTENKNNKISSNSISMMSININGIRSKKDTLAAFLDTNKPEIVAIQETKIDNNIMSSEIIPKECDYIIYRKDRTGRGGGVMLLVKKSIQQLSLNELENESESIWVKVKIDGNYHYIASWYRSPQESAQNIENLRSQLEKIRSMHNKEKLPNIHILGDLNYSHISWPDRIHREGRRLYPSEGKSLLDIMDDHSLTQLVNFPTREEATLDLIMTTTPDQFKEIYSPYKFSDHSAIKCILRTPESIKGGLKRIIKKYNQGNFDKMRVEASKFSCSTYLNGKENERNIDENWNLITSFINDTIKENVPTKVTRQNSLPWITDRIRNLIRRRDKAHKRSKQTGNISKWKKLQAKVTKLVSTAKENYLKINLENAKTEPKRFWRYIKNIRKEANHIPALKHNARLIETNKGKANVFNEQFSKVFSRKSYSSVPLKISMIPKMDCIEISPEGVLKLLKNLDGNKAAGPDEIHPKILKEIANEFTPVLTHFLRQSLATNSVPSTWETATICPIHKKGDRSDPANYRPVSLTSIVCKMLEHIISSSIMKHLEKYNIITDKQHAFRKYHSCETQLCTVVNDWSKELDKGNQVDIFFLDLEKAFDTVPHELLKSKLHSYGIDKTTLNWIDSFLCHRRQQVRVEGEYSGWSKVESGVPQGSVLGPLLFSIYMNDIIKNIDSEIRLFADDCVVYRPIKNAQDSKKLQKDIEKLEKWANIWGMRFQPYKCHIMHLTRNRNIIQNKYTLKDTVLKTVENTKYLGVTISNDLRWNAHINKTCMIANNHLNLLKRNIKCSDLNS
ncbi:MAG: reverse transcriptase domain-containing protein, partial [Cyanobacteria bacterium J06582_2]